MPFIACTAQPFTHPLQHVGDFVERAFCRLRQAEMPSLALRLACSRPRICGEALRDRQTGRVVLGAVDAQTGRQTLQRGCHARLQGSSERAAVPAT